MTNGSAATAAEIFTHQRPFVRNAETDLVEMRLAMASEGEVIQWAELDEIVGRDCRLHCQTSINTARTSQQREHGRVFAAERGVGIRLLPENEKAGHARSINRQAANKTRRAKNVLRATNYARLSADEQAQYRTEAAVTAIIGHFTQAKQRKSIASKTAAESQDLPIGRLLQMFGSSSSHVPSKGSAGDNTHI